LTAFLLAAIAWLASADTPAAFRFVILGDRTGEVQPGIWEQVWRETASLKPAFVAGVGDSIEGSKDETAEEEWQQVEKTLAGYRDIPLYLAPGNHDIWSDRSEQLFRRYAAHPPHYSFDYKQVHITVLDNSRSDELPDAELAFLEKDLQAHSAQPVKFILSHRPSWLFAAAFGNTRFPLHQLAKRFGVQYVIAGHVHQMLHIDLDGVTYLSLPSSGGHLRASKAYVDGWFFGYTQVDVQGSAASLQFHELKAPHGQGRVTTPKDWGTLGLMAH
jgi:UDP-2,3-diacylglucosamine pyrophosphatase LpxH